MVENIVEKVKKEEKKIAKDGKVFIKKEAFRNMLTHVLRYASTSIDTSVEVMGICMGKAGSNGKDQIIVNAIPVTHGSTVEVGFSQEDLIAFAQIDEEYNEKGLYALGWYHSHPGWGLFLSNTDIKNTLFYNKEATPYGCAIVFDHTLMGKEGNLGFDVFRLEDYKKGMSSDFVRVPYEIELPDTLEYFKWVQRLMEDSQKKEPILIKELNEFAEPAPSDLQEIPQEEGESADKTPKDPFPAITPIIVGFKQGTDKFTDTFMNIFKTQLGTWSNDLSQGTLKGTESLGSSVNQIKESISMGMDKVQKWFEKSVEELFNDFKNNTTEQLDKRVDEQTKLNEHSLSLQQDIIKDLTIKIGEKINNLFIDSENVIKAISEKNKENLQAKGKMDESIIKVSEMVTTLSTALNSIGVNTNKSIDATVSPFEESIVREIEKFNSDFNSVKDTFLKAKTIFQKLQKIIMDLRNL